MKKFISLVVFLILAVSLCLVACDGTGKVADNTEEVDAITKKCKLTKTYDGKSFLTEGIGEATIIRYVDGDTLIVNLPQDGRSETIRFHSVDTPESTTGVEKWGKAASLFVQKKLSSATQIVIEATAIPAERDSYGTRYLGYVWYRTSDTEDFKNLNLELVENGFSYNKGVDTSKYPYNTYFKQAEQYARSIKLRLFSDKDDPLYSTDPIETTLKDILDNLDVYYDAETGAGAKVQFEACLTDMNRNQTTTFTATVYDAETGKTYSIPVYAGYASQKASDMKVGHLYRIVGTVQTHSGNLQISGVSYDPIYGATNTSYTHPIQNDYYLTFDSSFTYQINYSQTLYTDVTVVSAQVADGVLTIVGTANQRTGADTVSEEAITFTFTTSVPEGYVNNLVEGSVFSVRGYQYEEDSHNITILNYSTITVK